MRSGIVVAACDDRGRLRLGDPRDGDGARLLGPAEVLFPVAATSGLVVLSTESALVRSVRRPLRVGSRGRLTLGIRLAAHLQAPARVLVLADRTRGCVYFQPLAAAWPHVAAAVQTAAGERWSWLR